MTQTEPVKQTKSGVIKTFSDHYEHLVRTAAQHEKLAFLLIFLLALLVRFVSVSLLIGLSSPPTYDGIWYDILAVQILNGEGYHEVYGPTAFKPPMYPFFLAGVYFLFGSSNYFAVRFIQITISSLTCIMIYFLGKYLLDRNIGLLAASGACFYPLFLYTAGLLYAETLFVFLLTFLLIVMLRALGDFSKRNSIICGILLGLCLLTRANLTSFIPALIVWPFLMVKAKNAVKIVSLVLMFAALTITPWTVRNYVVFHELIPLSTKGGAAFWQGNNPFANGGGSLATKDTWEGEDYPERGWLGWDGLSESQSSRKFRQAAMTWIREHPGDFLSLVPKKLLHLWSPTAYTTHSERKVNPCLTAVLFGPYSLFLSLAFYGIILLRKKWRRFLVLYAIIACVNLTAVITFGGTRFAIPMVPALIIFAAVGIEKLARRLVPTLQGTMVIPKRKQE